MNNLTIKNNQADIVTAFNLNAQNTDYVSIFSIKSYQANLLTISSARFFNNITNKIVEKEQTTIKIAESSFVVYDLEEENIKTTQTITNKMIAIAKVTIENNTIVLVQDYRSLAFGASQGGGADVDLEQIKADIEKLKKISSSVNIDDVATEQNFKIGLIDYRTEFLKDYEKIADTNESYDFEFSSDFYLKNESQTTSSRFYYSSFTYFNPLLQEQTTVNNNYISSYTNKYIVCDLVSKTLSTTDSIDSLNNSQVIIYDKQLNFVANDKQLNKKFYDYATKIYNNIKNNYIFQIDLIRTQQYSSRLYFKPFSFYNELREEQYTYSINSYTNVANLNDNYIYFNLANNTFESSTEKYTDDRTAYTILLYKYTRHDNKSSNDEYEILFNKTESLENIRQYLKYVETIDKNKNIYIDIRKSVADSSYIYTTAFTISNLLTKQNLNQTSTRLSLSISDNNVYYLYYDFLNKKYNISAELLNNTQQKYNLLLCKVQRKIYKIEIEDMLHDSNNTYFYSYVNEVSKNDNDVTDFSINLRRSLDSSTYVYFKTMRIFNKIKKIIENIEVKYVTINDNTSKYIAYNYSTSSFVTLDSLDSIDENMKILYNINRQNKYELTITDLR